MVFSKETGHKYQGLFHIQVNVIIISKKIECIWETSVPYLHWFSQNKQ